MDNLLQWGSQLIQQWQTAGGDTGASIFRAISFLGEQEFLLLLMPFLIWCVDASLGIRVTIAFLTSGYLNTTLKGVWQQPRPFNLMPELQLTEASGYGLPSGHAQSAVVIWGYLAYSWRKVGGWVAAITLILLIGLSRIYLGAHFPAQVAGGWFIGAAFLVAFVMLAPGGEAWLKGLPFNQQALLATVLPATMALLNPDPEIIAAMGVLMGFSIGLVIASRAKLLQIHGQWWLRGGRYLLGIAGLLALYFGLSAIFPSAGETFYTPLRFIRYALVGFWITLGAPWLFAKMKLNVA